jgi:uncharacterized protein YigE (DUF2233 family)
MRRILLSAAALAMVVSSSAAFAATAAKPAPAPAPLTDAGAIASVDAKTDSITLTDSTAAGKTTFKVSKANWKSWKVDTAFKAGDKVTVTYKVVSKVDWASAIKAAS